MKKFKYMCVTKENNIVKNIRFVVIDENKLLEFTNGKSEAHFDNLLEKWNNLGKRENISNLKYEYTKQNLEDYNL